MVTRAESKETVGNKVFRDICLAVTGIFESSRVLWFIVEDTCRLEAEVNIADVAGCLM